jgi:hypothetical protein
MPERIFIASSMYHRVCVSKSIREGIDISPEVRKNDKKETSLFGIKNKKDALNKLGLLVPAVNFFAVKKIFLNNEVKRDASGQSFSL